MQNRVIQSALLLTRLSLWLAIAVYGVMIFMLVYWLIDPTHFDQWVIVNPFIAGSAGFQVQRTPVDQGIALSGLSAGMMYWLAIRTTFFFLLVFLALRKVLKVLNSVNATKVFHPDNVKNFKQLAMIGLIYAILCTVNFGVIDGISTVNLAIPFEPLLFAAGCWVLSEIFAEGQRLKEDSNSII